MDFAELTNEQRRQLIDVQQAFATWWPATLEFEKLPTLVWHKAKGVRYLREKRGAVGRSLGRETPLLAKLKADHEARKKALKQRVKGTGARLEGMSRVNRALGLGRLRRIVAAILRELDREGLLGNHVIIAGTNALYAYETAYGLLIGSEHVATADADLLWDARKSLQLAATGIGKNGLMGILRRVDPSFNADYGFNATNNDGYIVDLLSPEIDDHAPLLDGLASSDLEATAMPGMQWLLDAPRFEQVVIADDGWPVRMVVPEPRTFALHKLWVSRQSSRKIVSQRKDAGHATLVAHAVRNYSSDKFVGTQMPWLPRELKSLLRDKAIK